MMWACGTPSTEVTVTGVIFWLYEKELPQEQDDLKAAFSLKWCSMKSLQGSSHSQQNCVNGSGEHALSYSLLHLQELWAPFRRSCSFSCWANMIKQDRSGRALPHCQILNKRRNFSISYNSKQLAYGDDNYAQAVKLKTFPVFISPHDPYIYMATAWDKTCLLIFPS